jgi:hypothetical protein
VANGSYWFSAPANGQLPYLHYAPQAAQRPAVAVPLDQVFTTAPAGTLPSTAPFSLVLGTSPFTYQINVDATSIWTFDMSPIRPEVRAGFDKFLSLLDGAGLKGGRLQQIRGWLAQELPQTFAETLYFRYGFDATQRCVELTPGMRLRLDFQSHQAVDPGSSPLNGFVGAGRAWLDIGMLQGSQGGQVLGFDPFLSQLQGLTVSPSVAGGGGAIDLQSPAYQMPYWRLHYPRSYPSSDGTGFVAAAQNPVLIGAPNRVALEAASTQYLEDGTILSPAVGVWFRGRTIVVPEIPVLIQGGLTYITLGTTLRTLYGGFAPMPWVAGRVTSQFLTRLNSPLFATGNAVQWTPLATYQLVSMTTPQSSAYYTYSDTLDCFDLPLLGGDSISFPASTG